MEEDIIIINQPITKQQLKKITEKRFGDLVKAVVDVEKGIMAIGGDLHADEESFLLKQGSNQENLWGINIYPDLSDEEMVEFDSMINIRPKQNNRTRSIDSQEIRQRIITIIQKLIQ